MAEQLRVLLLEDSDDDAELLVRELGGAWYDVRPRRVVDEAGLRSALAVGRWHLALLDYRLPTFSAPAALAVLAEEAPDTPAIVVSGAVGEEEAVETLKAGADDYVLKDNLTRLVPAVRRGLREAAVRREHRAARAALAESERRYRLLVERSATGIVEMAPDGTMLVANPALLTMLGVTTGEGLTDRSLVDLCADDEEVARLRGDLEDPGASGAVQLRLRRADGRDVWVVLDVVPVEHEGASRTLLGVLLDVSELRLTQEELALSLGRLRQTFEETVECLASLTELRDPYTAGHQRRVADLAAAIGGRLDYDEDRLEGLRVAAALHDVGKMHVPAEILAKAGPLSDVEMSMIKAHPTTGWELLRSVTFPWPVAEIVYQHHERMDGSGYPRGLQEEDVLPEAAVLAVADVVEAMSTHRPYRAAHGIEEALAHVDGQAGRAYDREVARACLQVWREDGFAFSTPARPAPAG